jgi:hypothetical protein
MKKSKKVYFGLIFILLAIYVSSMVVALNYYVDNSGNDSNNGTSIDHAWRTIAKVSSSTFQPGDQVLFKRGGVWRENLSVSSSGVKGNNIIYGAYGVGNKPLIDCADIVSNWTLYNGSIYVANVSSLSSSDQLYVDGAFYDIAHYPNSGFLIATADSPNMTSVIDSNFNLSEADILGAKITLKFWPWYILTSNITSYNSTNHVINFTPAIYGNMRKDYGYYLTNKFWMLDSPGEWYYNSSSQKIYLWLLDSSNPNDHTVEISNRSYGIYNSNKNYITIQDLSISNAEQNNIWIRDATGINIINLSITGGLNGINFETVVSNSSIINNSVQNSLKNGISAWGYGLSMINLDISNNLVNNSGNTGTCPKYSNAGIFIQGNSTNVTNNIITNSGYNGILFIGNLVNIQNNTIDRSCLVLDDCAGIYTASHPADYNLIKGNIITNSIGNYNGSAYSLYNSTQAEGIYLDSITYNTRVINNFVNNTDRGLLIASGKNNTILGNKFYNSRKESLAIASGTLYDYELASGNNITCNIFETNGSYVAYYQDFNHTIVNFGTYDYNQYCHPNTNHIIYSYAKINDSDISPRALYHNNLSEWRNFSGQDLNSVNYSGFCHNLPSTILNSSYCYNLLSQNLAYCWDGSCNNGEDCSSCPSDCGSCPDITYPAFSFYGDNNASVNSGGTALFNVTILNTNGTVLFSINGTNYTSNNISASVWNYSLLLSNGTYFYYWISWGNGTSHNLNVSSTRSYTVNATPDITYPAFSNYSDNNGTLTNGGTGIFNITLVNTNGTVILNFNNINYTATNSSLNSYSVVIPNIPAGTYSYYWMSYGNGTNHYLNSSQIFSYVVNAQGNSNTGTGGSSGGGSGSNTKTNQTLNKTSNIIDNSKSNFNNINTNPAKNIEDTKSGNLGGLQELGSSVGFRYWIYLLLGVIIGIIGLTVSLVFRLRRYRKSGNGKDLLLEGKIR